MKSENIPHSTQVSSTNESENNVFFYEKTKQLIDGLASVRYGTNKSWVKLMSAMFYTEGFVYITVSSPDEVNSERKVVIVIDPLDSTEEGERNPLEALQRREVLLGGYLKNSRWDLDQLHVRLMDMDIIETEYEYRKRTALRPDLF